MNIIVRPILHAIFIPIHAVVGIIATVLCNWLFLVLTMKIATQFDPSSVVFEIRGGTFVFILFAIAIGIANWLMKMFGKL